MTAPFYVDSGDSRLSINPGPRGVAILVKDGDWPCDSRAEITMSAEDATRVAAALILAAATATSHQSERAVSVAR